MLTKIQPKTGNLLIAEPFMIDENFKRSVILLTNCSEEGDFGFILNYTSDLLLNEALDNCPNAYFPVYYGGPVEPDVLNFVHCCPDKIPGGMDIGGGLYWSGDFEVMISKVNDFSLKEEEIRFFIGYTGWGPKQLEVELLKNSWMVSDNYNPDIIFDNTDSDTWKECIINMGQKFSHVANFPEDPQMN